MKKLLRIAGLLALLFVVATTATPRVSRAGQAVKHYVCPPCNLPCDAKVFDQPGVCPQCGMALIEQAPPRRRRPPARRGRSAS